MPFNGIDDPALPENIREMGASQRRIFVSAFNSVLQDCDGDFDDCESDAFAVAQSAVSKMILKDEAKRFSADAVVMASFGGDPFLHEAMFQLEIDMIEFLNPNDWHITLAYFPSGGEVMLNDLFTEPIVANIIGITTFDDGQDQSVPVVFIVERTDQLVAIHEEIIRRAVANGIEISEFSLDDWTPHITIGFDLIAARIEDFEPFSISTTRVAHESYHDIGIKTSAASVPGLISKLFKALVPKKKKIEFKDLSGFKLIGDDGHWVAWYTNAYVDREREYFPRKAISKDIDHMNSTGQYPELWFYHIPGTRFGEVKATALIGRFAVAVGSLDKTPAAKAFSQFAEENQYRMSHGFHYSEEALVDGVYNDYRTFELSVLPSDVAANQMTAFLPLTEEKEMADITVNRQQRDALKAALAGTGMTVEAVLEAGIKATEAADHLTSQNFKASQLDEGTSKKNIEAFQEFSDRLSILETKIVSIEAKILDDLDDDDDEEEEKVDEDEDEEDDDLNKASNVINTQLMEAMTAAINKSLGTRLDKIEKSVISMQEGVNKAKASGEQVEMSDILSDYFGQGGKSDSSLDVETTAAKVAGQMAGNQFTRDGVSSGLAADNGRST